MAGGSSARCHTDRTCWEFTLRSQRTELETNFYRPARFQDGQTVGRGLADRVQYLCGHRKRQSDGFAAAAEFERLQHGLVFRFRAGLHFGERHESADDVTQIRGGLLVARLGSNDAANTAVDVAAHREPGDRGDLAGHRLGQSRLRPKRVEPANGPRVATIERSHKIHHLVVVGDVVAATLQVDRVAEHRRTPYRYKTRLHESDAEALV